MNKPTIQQAVDLAMQDNYVPPTPEQEKEALAQFAIRELNILKTKKSMRIVVKPPTFIDRFKMGSKNFQKNLTKALSKKGKK